MQNQPMHDMDNMDHHIITYVYWFNRSIKRITSKQQNKMRLFGHIYQIAFNHS